MCQPKFTAYLGIKYAKTPLISSSEGRNSSNLTCLSLIENTKWTLALVPSVPFFFVVWTVSMATEEARHGSPGVELQVYIPDWTAYSGISSPNKNPADCVNSSWSLCCRICICHFLAALKKMSWSWATGCGSERTLHILECCIIKPSYGCSICNRWLQDLENTLKDEV